jgi:hypothetical protein
VRVFHEYGRENGESVESIVSDIIGTQNYTHNAVEYLLEEFGISTDEPPPTTTDFEKIEWEEVFGAWLAAKNRRPGMKEEIFQLLVRNDVNAYTAIVRRRRSVKIAGTDYGHKIWLLTLDRMSWRMPKLLNKTNDSLYAVSMGIHYLINYVATLAQVGNIRVSEEALPAMFLLSEADMIPAAWRENIAKLFSDKSQKRYVIDRRIRELVHDLKNSTALSDELFAVEDLVEAPTDT